MIVSIVKWQFASIEHDDRGINETRGHACEIVARRFLALLQEGELLEYLLPETPPFLPASDYDRADTFGQYRQDTIEEDDDAAERAALICRPSLRSDDDHGQHSRKSSTIFSADVDPIHSLVGLNALEVAAVA